MAEKVRLTLNSRVAKRIVLEGKTYFVNPNVSLDLEVSSTEVDKLKKDSDLFLRVEKHKIVEEKINLKEPKK